MEPERSSDFARLFVLSSELLATIGKDGCFQTLNPAWQRVLGWSIDELRGRQTYELIHPDDRGRTDTLERGMGAEVYDFENRYAHKRGGWRWLRWRAWSDGEVWFAAATDVTESKELERKALADPLTNLPNRLLLNDRLEHALERLERSGGTSRWCSWTWTGSRWPTTPWATRPATRCCRRPPSGCPRPCAGATPSPAWAATSS